ncbi:MAG TPA: DUF1385 domain-containing protein [Labilithrix sp.]|nr:DUF1385 domain-containing protein [Labilithrix sp.]
MEIIGGQALLEGVAFRSARWRVAARRCENGDIAIAVGQMARTKLLEVPFVRGFITWFVDAPTELQWAAAELEEELDRRDTDAKPVPSEHHDYRGSIPMRVRSSLPPPGTRRAWHAILVLTAVCALPQVTTDLLMRVLGIAAAPSTALFGAAMLALFLAVVVAYFLLVARVFPDIRRTFQYNAAFKMALWSARDEEEPTTRTITRHPSWHYQSSLVAIVLSAAALALLPAAILAWVPPIQGGWVVQHGVVLGTRLLLLPIIVISVDEGLRALGRLGHGGLMRVLCAPLAFLDGLVVRAPTDKELAVAVAALRELRRVDEEDRI